MSANNPGVIYDATNSWNGYNHQGKISMWYAISEITKLYNLSLHEIDNKAILENYFLEIEHMEDFSIGKIENGNLSYMSVHQVKNRADKSINSYESAVLGLLAHLSEYDDIECALLHTTEEVDLADKALLDNLKGFVKAPKHLIDVENKVINKRNDMAFRDALTISNKGRPTTLKTNLVNVLTKKYSCANKLDENNLDEAFDLYLDNINAEKTKLSSLSEEQMKKVSICTYTLNGATTNYCCVDCAIGLLKFVIKDFYQKIYPGSYKTTDEFVHKSTLWILGKLDDHIIERDLHYDFYTRSVLDRRIPFSTIMNWLTSSDIDKHDSWYYLHYIKEGIFSKLERYCKTCNERNIKCSICNVVECKNKLGSLSFYDFKNLIYVMNPTVTGILDMNSFSKYLGNGISNPFAKGLRDISKSFDSKCNAISYKDNKNIQCALTTIVGEGSDNDIALISSDILMNSNVYDLLMDYDCLISKDINIPSIKDEEILQAMCYDSRESEHIAHCKDVKILPLDVFIEQLSKTEEYTAL